MPGQSKTRSARGRAPQQMELFAEDGSTIGTMPTWSGLPRETQTALTTLMKRMILDHADKRQLGSTGGGHDV